MDDARQLHYYRLETEEALRELHSQPSGLSTSEALSRASQYGRNELEIKHKEPFIITYSRQFKDLMIILLLVSSLVATYLGDGRTAVVLLVLVFFNTTIGFLQEYKAGRVMDSLERLVVGEATVIRDGGKRQSIPTPELTVGDIVYLEEGDAVPADLRIIQEDELSTNDFALTGESQPARKFTHAIQNSVPLGNRHNLAFMGTTVATGHGIGVVIGVGPHTELGRIANLSQNIEDELSPLQKETNNIAKRVSQGTIILCAILLPVAISSGLAFKDALLFAIGIASAIIPQGVPAEINAALAQATNKLAKRRALVKKLSAVEGLGATSVICTDKTGTLTKNQMTVEQFLVGEHTYGVTGNGYEPTGTVVDEQNDPLSQEDQQELEFLFAAAAMASNARVNPPDAGHATWYCLGDPTEGALITLAKKAGVEPDVLDKQYPEIKEFSFDSGRKRMSSVRTSSSDDKIHIFAKGAPESLLECCDSIWDRGTIRKLTRKDRNHILKANETLATQAMRNLGVAYRVETARATKNALTMEQAESKLVWLGMMSMVDPLREQVANAMEAARKAYIKVSIVTGDYATTAKALAIRAKLTANPDDIIVVQGEELQKLSDTQIYDLASRGGVIFSRVAPEDKLRIVKLVQEAGKVVAVTGDGINDAPALKRADIGVAMGLTGTDVAKQSAEIILLDDSFNTLVGAIQQGRVIFNNIRKGVLCAFTSNAAELIVNLISLAAATLFGIPLALSVMQILAIDLVAELFPIAALGKDKADGELMNQPPRNPHDHILNLRAIGDLLWCGLLMGGLAYLNYIWFFYREGVHASGLATGSTVHMQATALTYLTIVLSQLFNIVQRRSSSGIFTRYQLHNRLFWGSVAFSLFCVVNIIYNPWIAPYFKASALSVTDWLYAFGGAIIFVLVREFQRHNSKHHRKAVLALHHQVMAIKKSAG